jgi:cytochrome c nitrite reductase small subunit
MRVRLGIFGIVIAVVLGMTLGVGGYTFHYAAGFSYFSSDPKACANCHIMNDQYDSWQKSGHHAAATCVECHLPHELVPKYIAKGLNGYHHSKAFTLQDFHEPIMIGPRNAEILQENCLRCHGDLVDSIVHGSKDTDSDVRCVKCHADVGHGPVR